MIVNNFYHDDKGFQGQRTDEDRKIGVGFFGLEVNKSGRLL